MTWSPRPAHRHYLLEGTLLATLILGPAVAIAVTLDLERGNMADWVAAIATTAAFIAAVFAARYAASAYELESQREERLLIAQDQAQAEKVAAWVAEVNMAKVAGSDGFGWRVTTHQTLHALNASSLPVVSVNFAYEVRVATPSGSTVYPLGNQQLALLPPSPSSQTIKMPKEIVEALTAIANQVGDHATGLLPEMLMSVGLVFTDTGDRHWIRENNGRLLPAPDLLVQQRQRDRAL